MRRLRSDDQARTASDLRTAGSSRDRQPVHDGRLGHRYRPTRHRRATPHRRRPNTSWMAASEAGWENAAATLGRHPKAHERGRKVPSAREMPATQALCASSEGIEGAEGSQKGGVNLLAGEGFHLIWKNAFSAF